MRKTWTYEETGLLCERYSNSTKKELKVLFPLRTEASINLKASNLGLRKIYKKHPNVQASLENLLLEDVISYYWVGFLLADGSFTIDRFKLTVATKDDQHLIRFCDFIECCNYHNSKNGRSISVSVQDKHNVPQIMNKFDIRKAKTYNPPVLQYDFSTDLFTAFLIGFIDGDGNIQRQTGRLDCFLRIKIHSTWLNFLCCLVVRLSRIVGCNLKQPKINKAGYTEWTCANSLVTTFLKKVVLKLEIPALERKWDLIDENFVSRYQIAKENIINITELARQGFRNVEIASILGLSQSCVCSIRKNKVKI